MRFSVFTRKPVESAPPAPEDATLRFIVITQDEPFYTRLYRIAETCNWQIARAESVDQIQKQIGRPAAPIVVYERDWDDGDWRSGLMKLNQTSVKPCVLLASRVADQYLWQEVVRNHGYDILPKTAPDEKLIRLLRFAWFWARSSGQPDSGIK